LYTAAARFTRSTIHRITSPTPYSLARLSSDATIVCVALAEPVVADPELREAVPEAAEEEEAIDTRSVYGSD
jgi:hypothetical protein